MRLVAAGIGEDGALEPFGRQREVGVAGEFAGQEFGGVDHHLGRAVLDRSKHLARAGDHDVAAEHEIGAAGSDADRVDRVGSFGEADIAEYRAALLRQAGHVEHADALPSRCAAMPKMPPTVTMPVPPTPVTTML